MSDEPLVERDPETQAVHDRHPNIKQKPLPGVAPTRVILQQATKLRKGDTIWRPGGHEDTVTLDAVRDGITVSYETTERGEQKEAHWAMVPIIITEEPPS